MSSPPAPLAVVGARGGLGATALAAACAAAAGAVLVDVDGLAGGVDVGLGIESVPGVRWSGLGLAGGHLAAADLVAALPAHGTARVLAADAAHVPGAAELAQVLDVLAGYPVVVDLPRRSDAVSAAAQARCGLLAVLVPASVAGVVAAQTYLGTVAPALAVGAVVTGRGAGPVWAARVGVPLLGVLPSPAARPLVAAGLVAGWWA